MSRRGTISVVVEETVTRRSLCRASLTRERVLDLVFGEGNWPSGAEVLGPVVHGDQCEIEAGETIDIVWTESTTDAKLSAREIDAQEGTKP